MKNVLIVVLFTLLFQSLLLARETFEFSLGENLKVMSDKVYRKTKENRIEAVGNVVIIHGNRSLYGETAALSMTTGEMEIAGNVRYTDAEVTIYGAKLLYNMQTKKVTILEARIIADQFSITGKELSKLDDKNFYGENAEFSSCKDCPESWSVQGKKVYITAGEYVRIKHALIKVKGVVTTYVPYIVFPIKKGRESGVLFPKLSFDFSKGIIYKQPLFWAIDDSKDMTLTPSFWGKRGAGTEIEYRQKYGGDKWVQFDGLTGFDRIYQPYTQNDQATSTYSSRSYSLFEHHYNNGTNLNHHLSFSRAFDLDLYRDYSDYLSSKTSAPDEGVTTFLEHRSDKSVVALEAHERRNLIVNDPQAFDSSYVQVLPRFSFFYAPTTIFSSETFFLKKSTFFVDGELVRFAQNRVDESLYYRNARRLSLSPKTHFYWKSLGPVEMESELQLRQKRYDLPTKGGDSFNRRVVFVGNEFSITLTKDFGKATLEETIDTSTRDAARQKKTEKLELLNLPPEFNASLKDEIKKKSTSAYRHIEEIKLKHTLLTLESFSGSEKLKSQFTRDEGTFDQTDLISNKDGPTIYRSLSTALPEYNTIEFQWNNQIIEKQVNDTKHTKLNPSLREQYLYSKIFHFNLSQGLLPEADSRKFTDYLTRLAMTTGTTLGPFSLDLTDYYFYTNHQHLLSTTLKRTFKRGELGTSLAYDPISAQIEKTLSLFGKLRVSDYMTFLSSYDYDLRKNASPKSLRTMFGAEYLPSNNCWKYSFQYQKDQMQKKISFNFMLNFNSQNYGAK